MKIDRETLRQNRQVELDAAKTQAERNKMGQFSTPFPLAFDIVNSLKPILPKGKINFLEPAVGLGVFYSAIEKCLGKRCQSATGIEIEPHYANPSREIWKGSLLKIVRADFLACDPTEEFNVLVTNPPYVRHHHIPTATKKHLGEMVKNQCGFALSGLAGLYCYFMMLSPRWMMNGGVMSFLVPSEFMDVNYGISVKRFLLECVELVSIHRFAAEDLQFDDALVSSCVVTYRKRKPKADICVKFSIGQCVSKPRKTVDIPADQLRPESKWTNYFESGLCREVAKKTIGDFFSVKRGVATGENRYFIVGENIVREYNIPRTFLKPVLPAPRYLKKIELSSPNDIKVNGEMKYLFTCAEKEETLRLRHPGVWRYICEGRNRKVNEGYICKNRSPWYYCPFGRPAQIVLPNMARAHKDGKVFRFVLNQVDAVGTNSYLAFYPKACVEELLRDESILRKVWQALNDLPQDVLTRGGRFYGGGLQKLEPREVMNLSADTFSSLFAGATRKEPRKTIPSSESAALE